MPRMTLPWPPTVNHYWHHDRTGNVFIGTKGRAYRKEIVSIIGPKFPTMLGRLEVEVHAYVPDNRRRDLDNLFKSVLDALEHAKVYENDGQIDVLIISRHEKVDGGCVVVNVEEIKEPSE